MADAEEKIRTALMALVERFPYDAISVQGICDEAGLSRKTFSRHFSTKEDVVFDQLKTDLATPTTAILDLLPAGSFADSETVMLKICYGNFYAHRDLYRKVADTLGMAWLMERVMAVGRLIGTQPYEEDGIDNRRELDFVITLYSGVTAAALRWWMENDFALTTDELVQWVVKWAYTRYPEMVGRTE